MAAGNRICLGAIAGAHGVKGAVRVRTFTEQPRDIGTYGPLTDEAGEREYRLTVERPAKGGVIARIMGVDDRPAAESLKGTGLYVARGALPETSGEDEYYHADLIDLEVRQGGEVLGRVEAIQNYGAGDLIEISRAGKKQTILVPFTREIVRVVDIAKGYLEVDLPGGPAEDGIEDGAEDGAEETEG